LEVTAGANMEVNLGSGYMFANGFMYENDSTKTLEHDVADNDNDRIDRVVIRFDRNPDLKEREGNKAIILKGAPDSNPKPPEIVREGYIYDMSVAQVRIIAGKSFIEDEEITDERSLEDLSGYIPLHNIYRGMQINEYGTISMPNQSYVEMNDYDASYERNNNIGGDYRHYKIKINPMIDNQNEVKDGVFKVSESGTYSFSIHMRLYEDGVPSSDKVESFDVINGKTSARDRLYFFNTYGGNIQFFGSNIKHLNKGDEIELYISFLRYYDFVFDYIRFNIAKIN